MVSCPVRVQDSVQSMSADHLRTLAKRVIFGIIYVEYASLPCFQRVPFKITPALRYIPRSGSSLCLCLIWYHPRCTLPA